MKGLFLDIPYNMLICIYSDNLCEFIHRNDLQKDGTAQRRTMHNILQIILLTAGMAFSSADGPEIVLRGEFHASSELVDGKDCFESEEPHARNIKYGVQNLFDGNFKTAWAEGVKGRGIGEAVYLSIPYNYKIFNIFNGFGKNLSLYKNNSRAKRIKLTCYAGISPKGYVSEISEMYKSKIFPKEYHIDLEDKFTVQSFPFPFSGKELKDFQDKYSDEFKKTSSIPISIVKTILKIELIDVYKGAKHEDTCISEIFFSDKFICDTSDVKFANFNKIYADDKDNGTVRIELAGKKSFALLQDNKSVFQIAEYSRDKNWVSIIKMPAKAEGRIETEYLLLNIRTGRIVNAEIEKTTGIRLSSFTLKEKDGFITLEHPDGEIRLFEGMR